MTPTRRRPGRRPEPRTATVDVAEGPYQGWACTIRADFPARLLAELQSGSIDRILAALERIVVEHNFPNTEGELAAELADVDPYDGLMTVAGLAFDAIGKLPPR